MTSPVQHSCDPQQAHLILDQVQRILGSPHFNGSELLRNLLTHLARRAVERPGEPVKEYDLAVDVLGRDPAFDSRLDSAVRVHTARLRSKLAEYYMAGGADDPFVIEVPKGSYLITWRTRAGRVEVEAPIAVATPVVLPQRRFEWKAFSIGLMAATLVAALAWGAFLLTVARPAPALRSFWNPFLDPAAEPIVAFSNHRFVGMSSTGLLAYREGVDSPSQINDTYSGTGTVMAVQEIGNLFAQFHRGFRLKRAELLTWDEAQKANLILVGSPEANSRLRQLPPLQYFDFKSSRTEPRLGVGGILNLHPRAGEESIYYGSTNPYSSDYAVIAMLPGLRPEKRILVLAGTNTYGVQAAAEFICRSDLVGELLAHLNSRPGDRVPDFEALVYVTVSSGVPVSSKLVLVRSRQR